MITRRPGGWLRKPAVPGELLHSKRLSTSKCVLSHSCTETTKSDCQLLDIQHDMFL